jgi:hypothetical protein
MSTVLMERISPLSTYAYYQSEITVIVRDKYGCTATAKRFHIRHLYSKLLYPNGDGNLDDGPGCTNNYPDLSFSILIVDV